MTLKAITKEDFTKPSKAVTISRPKRVKDYTKNEPMCIKMALFGPIETGKTYSIWELIELGYKVFYISTDIGGSGIETVEIEAKLQGKYDLLRDRLRSVELYGDAEVQAFLNDPASVYPDIYEFDPDFLFWDGFSIYQAIDVMERVGEYESGNPDPAVGDGAQLTQKQWGQVRNITIRALDRFCSLHNRKTGRIWHKIVTLNEAIGSNKHGETRQPMLAGQAYSFFTGSFTLIIRSTKERLEKGGARYWYHLKSTENLAAKVRGFRLPEKMEGSMGKLWSEIRKQAGLSGTECLEEITGTETGTGDPASGAKA